VVNNTRTVEVNRMEILLRRLGRDVARITIIS